MAAYANGIEITQETISPASSPPSTVHRPSGKGERKEAMSSSKGDSHSSLVYQSQKGRHYGTVGKGRHRENGHTIHNITASDTLQGIALKYGVTIADIQRANLLLGNESIHRYKILKIPLSVSSSPQSSPRLDHRKTETRTRTSSSQLISSMEKEKEEEEEEEEEEVKRKPSSLVAGERDIMSLLNAVDQQLLVSKSFADKLAEKNQSIALPPDAYNRERPTDRSSDTEDDDSFSDKVKRVFAKTYKWSPTRDTEVREKVEDELFQL